MWIYWLQFFGYLLLGYVLLKISRLITLPKVENLFIDEGEKTPVLSSSTFGLSTKPDAIIKDEYGRIVLIQNYPDGNTCVNDDLIIQAKCASLVARENNYPVERILISNGADIDILPPLK